MKAAPTRTTRPLALPRARRGPGGSGARRPRPKSEGQEGTKKAKGRYNGGASAGRACRRGPRRRRAAVRERGPAPAVAPEYPSVRGGRALLLRRCLSRDGVC